MRSSSSTPNLTSSLANLGALSLGKDFGKPRSLVVPRGSERTWSSPALSAAFGLRRYAVEMHHIPGERVPRPFAGDPMEIPVEKIDLIGGNGKWRQIKANEEFKRIQLEEEEKHRQELRKEATKKQRHAELAERKRRQQLEEERRWQEEREQKRRDQVEREKVKRENEEKLRLQQEEAQEEKRRRMPKTCETCDGSAKCQECLGKGFIFSVFLVPSVSAHGAASGTSMDHGRVHQGCDKCGGYSHNMLGELKQGTGKCSGCEGLGKIWPVIDNMESAVSPKATRTTTMSVYGAERTGEVKVT